MKICGHPLKLKKDSYFSREGSSVKSNAVNNNSPLISGTAHLEQCRPRKVSSLAHGLFCAEASLLPSEKESPVICRRGGTGGTILPGNTFKVRSRLVPGTLVPCSMGCVKSSSVCTNRRRRRRLFPLEAVKIGAREDER